MTFRRSVARAIMLALVFALASSAADRPPPPRQHELQLQAREQAQGLVTRVLDVQLQNLEENKLQGHPIYRDIKAMRANINSLIAEEMPQVIELLSRAHDVKGGESDKAAAQARQLIRDVVARLAAERQQLRQRLKSAELHTQVQRLIETQADALKKTQALPELPASRREKAALVALENQRDVEQRDLQLAAALRDVGNWGGETGASAAEAVRSIETDRVDAELDRILASLEKGHYDEAVRSQEHVLHALHRVRERLSPTSGNPQKDGDEGILQRLIERQTAVRERTRHADLSGPDADALVQAQNDVRKELDRLARRPESTPGVREEFDQARSTAFDATRRLFDAQRDMALTRQSQVLERLAKISEQTERSGTDATDDRSARELADATRELERADAAMKRIRSAQAQAHQDSTEKDPEPARRAEERVAAELETLAKEGSVPAAVATRLASARDAAEAAVKALGRREDAPPDSDRRRAVSKADAAVERAASEVEAALDDIKRQARAARIGETARAAEVVERAASAELEIAETTRQASLAEGLSGEALRELHTSQQQIGRIAEKIAAALDEPTPELARELKQVRETSESVARELGAAEAQPRLLSKPAVARASDQAESAAASLSRIARQLRADVTQGAGELSDESARQARKAGTARAAVEQAIESSERPIADRLLRLEEARRQVRNALADQQRAAGRPQAAEAMEQSERVRQVAEQQAAATEAARRATDGDPTAPLEAVTAQQQAAEQAAQLAEEARSRVERNPDPADPESSPSAKIAGALRQAAAASDRAGRALFDRNAPTAAKEAAAARAALEQAQQLADAAVAAASAIPPGPPDAAAQQQVGKEAAAAREQASADAPFAAATLERAEQSSREAVERAASGDSDRTRTAQRESESTLWTAEQQIRSAMDELSKQQLAQMRAQATEAGRLAEQVSPADPAALGALREAEAASNQTAASPSHRNSAQSRAKDETQRAADSLAAREQRIQRDQAAAQAIADSAIRQQSAAEQIAESRKTLNSEPDDSPTVPNPKASSENPPAADSKETEKAESKETESSSSRKRQQAARKLREAQEQFAESQRATGQGAEEIAGQSEIANLPLREALELASQLPQHTGTGDESSTAPAASPEGNAVLEGPSPTGREHSKPSAPKDGGSPAGNPQAGSGAALGTTFIPNSPDVTAQMMAGRKASSAVSAAGVPASKPGAGTGQPGSGQPSDEPGDSEPGDGKPGDGVPSDGPGGVPGEGGADRAGGTPSGKGMQKGPQPAGAVGVPDDKNANGLPGKILREEPWLLRLPPELRKAIRARSQRPAPRSYEERLQRYFESIE